MARLTGVQPGEKGRAMAGQYSYDGWSCVRRMENNEPPLMQCYSNPKKARLTVEVCTSRGSLGALTPCCSSAESSQSLCASFHHAP